MRLQREHDVKRQVAGQRACFGLRVTLPLRCQQEQPRALEAAARQDEEAILVARVATSR